MVVMVEDIGKKKNVMIRSQLQRPDSSRTVPPAEILCGENEDYYFLDFREEGPSEHVHTATDCRYFTVNKINDSTASRHRSQSASEVIWWRQVTVSAMWVTLTRMHLPAVQGCFQLTCCSKGPNEALWRHRSQFNICHLGSDGRTYWLHHLLLPPRDFRVSCHVTKWKIRGSSENAEYLELILALVSLWEEGAWCLDTKWG